VSGDDVILNVSDLSIAYPGKGGLLPVVNGLDFTLGHSETLGIVGESGSGKTQSVLALMGLLPDNAAVSGSARFAGQELIGLSQQALNTIRGNRIAMVFQDPMTSLNPHLTIGQQMCFVLKTHLGLTTRDATARAVDMLDAVQIPEAKKRINQYPHELSGGMRQRVMIASALLCKPELLIADEPTTALDVTVQAQILNLLKSLQQDFSTSILLITHDMGVVAGNCDRLLVMQSGNRVEYGNADDVFYSPQHSYTQALLKAVPRLDAASTDLSPPEQAENRLKVDDLEVVFKLPGDGIFAPDEALKALRGIGFTLIPGETLGVVGESGCGKSTMARAVLRLLEPSAGSVDLLGDDLLELDARELRNRRTDIQIIFQDPLASLNPRMTIADILLEPLDTFPQGLTKKEKLERAGALLEKVGLQQEHLDRYPHEFSGGQCQRIGIARALMFNPKVLICDEAVSALDVSVQAKIVRLLIELQKELGLSLIFIAHDLAVVRQISHRVMVMYLGKVVEVADRDALYDNPLHPYTKALISAVPVPDPDIQKQRNHIPLEGDLPSPLNPPSGCAFRSRCSIAEPRCASESPDLKGFQDSSVACHLVGD